MSTRNSLQKIDHDIFWKSKANPEVLIVKVDNIINQYKSIAVIGYVAYHKLDKAFNSNTFSISAVKGKLGVNALELQKSLYDLVCLTTWAQKRTL